MTGEELHTAAMALPGATHSVQWGDDNIYKVGGKIFAFCGGADSVGLKCGRDRDEADELIQRFPGCLLYT